MSDEPENIGAHMTDGAEDPVLQYLRRISERLEQLGTDMAEMRAKMASMRTEMVVVYHVTETIDARFERMEKRLDRIAV